MSLRYLALSYAFSRMSLEESDEHAGIILADGEIPPDVRRFLLEHDLGAVVPTLFGPLLARDLGDVPVELSFGAAADPMPTASVPTVTSGPQRSAVVFPRALLDERLPQTDEHTAWMCERQCADLRLRRTLHRGLAGQIPCTIPAASRR